MFLMKASAMLSATTFIHLFQECQIYVYAFIELVPNAATMLAANTFSVCAVRNWSSRSWWCLCSLEAAADSIDIYIYTAYTYIYIKVYIHMYVFMCLYIYIYTYVCIHIHMYEINCHMYINI